MLIGSHKNEERIMQNLLHRNLMELIAYVTQSNCIGFIGRDNKHTLLVGVGACLGSKNMRKGNDLKSLTVLNYPRNFLLTLLRPQRVAHG